MTGFIPSDLGIVDMVIILFMLVGLFEGFIKGLSFEIPKFAAMLAGIWTALIVATPAAEYLSEKVTVDGQILEAVLVLTIAFTAAFLFKIVFLLIGKIVSLQFIYFVERVIGSLIGGIRFVFLFCFISYALLLWPTEYFQPYYGDLSYLGAGVTRVIPKFDEFLLPATHWVTEKLVPQKAPLTQTTKVVS